MAIFKRYNTRKRRTNWSIVLWILGILTVFAATATVGYILGEKAEGGETLLPSATNSHADGITIAPLAERSVHGEYAEPDDISDFTSDDPLALVSTWLYRNGVSLFATETDRLLGQATDGAATLSEFNIDAATSGFFEVSCVYADDKVRSIIETYERSLIDEFSSGPDEIVLVFNNITSENYEDILDFAESVNATKLLCVPYTLLKDELCARFFSEAAEKQLTVALMANDLREKQLIEDIENFAFYFTKYNVRLVLLGTDDYLLDILQENNIFNYQFYSPRETDKAEVTAE